MDAQEKRLYIAIIVTVIIFGAILIYFFISLLRQHRRRIKLERESRQVELKVLENERKRMANDLHDELYPILTAIKMGISNVQPINEDDRSRLEKTHGFIDVLSKRMREISFNLMPAVLLRKGLFQALEELAAFINRNGNLQVTMVVPTADIIMLSEVESINIYRIVQEIVHNTIKHSRATELRIEVSIKVRRLHLYTFDNGIGFNYDKAINEQTGLGIRSIEGRIDLMGGEIDIHSKPGKGAAYIIQIPLLRT